MLYDAGALDSLATDGIASILHGWTCFCELTDSLLMRGGKSFDLESQLGSTVASLDRSASVYQTLADQATARRLSTSGVSIDEELTQLIQHQTAYQAAARIVGVVNDMMQTLVNMG